MPKPAADHSAANCSFTYRDGRKCRALHSRGSTYCFYHDRLHRRDFEADVTAAKVSEPLELPFVSCSSLNAALTRLFAAVADGRIAPKTADQLIKLAGLLHKNIPMANQEFLTAFSDPKAWRRLIRYMYDPNRYPYPGSTGEYDATDPNGTTRSDNQPQKSELPTSGQEFATEVLQKVIFS
jgi:hypothetical protein